MTKLLTEKLSTQASLLAIIGKLTFVLVLSTAMVFAVDRTIINGTSCKVTEEDYDLDVCKVCLTCNINNSHPNAYGCYHLKDVYLRVDFPDPDPSKPGTHWRFGLRNDGRTGLRLVDVSVKAAQLNDLTYIIKDAGMADIYVPYDDGSNRYYDMQYSNPDDMDQIETADLQSELSTVVYLRRKTDQGFYDDDAIPRVGVECRDSGFAWSCKNHNNPSEDIRRRLHEVVLWGVSDAGNYDNTIEYRFREDGSMGFRYGPTGFDSPSHVGGSHIHDALWRISTKLFGETTSEVLKFRHVDNNDGTFHDTEDSVPKETSVLWEPTEFTSLIVQSSTRQNVYGHPMGYEFTPWDRTGTARQSTDKWTLNDYYLTNDNPGEDGFGSNSPNDWRLNFHTPDTYLLSFLNNETLGATGDGIVLWYISSAHHEPTDADNQPGSGNYTGVTAVHWNGFDMEPHNIFEYNPVGGPAMCYP